MAYRIVFIFLLQFIFIVSGFAQKKDSLQNNAKEEIAFMPGDIVISANLGYPHVTPALIRASIFAYEKLVTDQTLSFSVSNHGVYNLKAEYCLFDNLGLGLVASYWDMKVNIQNNYIQGGMAYTDDLGVSISATAFGVRGNYHFADEIDSKMIDAYTGLSIGATYYQKDLVLNSTNPNRQLDEALPKRILNFNNGWATYFSPTLGFRFFPVRFLGLNAELGWDRGAFFFFGAALRIGTKPIKSLQN